MPARCIDSEIFEGDDFEVPCPLRQDFRERSTNEIGALLITKKRRLSGWVPIATTRRSAMFNAWTRTSRWPLVIGSKEPG